MKHNLYRQKSNMVTIANQARKIAVGIIVVMIFLLSAEKAWAQTPASPVSTVTNVTNCTAVNGGIQFTSQGANVVFSIDGGATYGVQGQLGFFNLAPGTYQTRARHLTSGIQSAVVNKVIAIANPPVTPTSSVTATNCSTPTGRILFSAPTPLNSYQFSIDGGATFGATGQTNFPNLSAGNYNTVVKNVSTGCVSSVTVKAIGFVAAPASLSSTVTNVTNCNTPNGQINFTFPTPVASYQFSIDGGATFGTAGQTAFTNLAPGTYKTVVRSVATGCVSLTTAAATKTLIITGAPATPTSTVANSNCNAPTGSITFSAPAPASHVFSVDGGATYAALGVSGIFNLAPGTYATRAKNNSTGCVSTITNKTITNVASPVAPTSSLTAVTNCNIPNGRILFSAPTPVANHQFSVDGGVTFGATGVTSFTGLAPGTYPTVVRNAVTGCVSSVTATATKTIGISGAPAAPTSTATPSSCTASTGTITFTAPNTNNHIFSVFGGDPFGDPLEVTFDSLSPGNYVTVAKSIATGCVSATALRAVAPVVNVASPTTSLINTSDCNDPNGSIQFTAPALATHVFSIDGGESYGVLGKALFGALLPGTYELQAMHLNSGCTSPVVPVTLTALPAVPAPQSTIANMSECNPTGGSIRFTAPTPLTNYQFSIDGGENFGPANQFLFSNLTVGTYQTVAKNLSTGCTSVVVNKVLSYNLASVVATVTSQNGDPCLPNTGSISIAATGGNGVYEYSLNGGQTYTDLTQNPLTVSSLPSGNYIVVVRDKTNIICIDQEVVSLEAANCPVSIPLSKD